MESKKMVRRWLVISLLNKLGLFFLVALFASCSATVVKHAEEIPPQLRLIAVLPPVSEVDVTRERSQALEQSLRQELTDRGFTLVAPNVVRRFCETKDCSKKFTDTTSPLGYATKLKSDAVAQIALTSTHNANLLLARYSSIAGSVSLFNAKGNLISSVTDSTSERGGLLFNTGQLLEGIKGTVSNYQETPFTAVSERFVRGLVQELPVPQGQVSQASEELTISKAELYPLGQSRYRVCLKGTPDSNVVIQLQARQIPLRQVSDGVYCNLLLLDGSSKGIAAMLQSPLGTSVSSQLELTPRDTSSKDICAPNNAVAFQPESTFRLRANECQKVKFIIFKGSSAEGPFQALSTLSPQKMFTARERSPVYAVVAVSPEHGASLPFVISNNSK